MLKVGIINVTGYSGMELARILSRHSEVEIVSVTGRSAVGKKVNEILPHLHDVDLTIEPEISGSLDFVFSALPNVFSAEALKSVISSGIKCIDIAADFRLKDLKVYEQWYSSKHPCPEFLQDSVYGLPELYRSDISKSNVVANPGCYPTASILGLAPALESKIISTDILIDAKSGVSGAGRGLSLKTHFDEVDESVSAYGLDGHRHMPEIKQELSLISNEKVSVTFVPHLIPMNRGILATIYAPLSESFKENNTNLSSSIQTIYKNYYQKEPFVNVQDSPPATKHTLGSNYCHIYPTVDYNEDKLLVISCIDNLVKGAAGQAIQNMNIMCDIPENLGLTNIAIYP